MEESHNPWPRPETYATSRNYFFDIHNKGEKLAETKKDDKASKPDDIEDTTKIVISLYESQPEGLRN